MKSFQNSKMKTIHLKKVVGFYAIDALLLREVLLVYFVVSITPALICRGLEEHTTSVVNKVACDRVIYQKGESNVSKI